MIFVATGYLIALANIGDALHQRAKLWAAEPKVPLVVSEYVLVEVGNYFSKVPDRGRADTVFHLVRTDSQFTLRWATKSLFEARVRLRAARPDKEWSLTDCISFHVMSEMGIRQALAHDIHFEQAGFDALLRRDPPP